MINAGLLQLVPRLAWRSLFAHRIKSLVVGIIIALGVFVLVFTDAVLDSIGRAMESSITSSITGHLQVSDARAEDKVTLLGVRGNFFSTPKVGQLDQYEPIREALTQHSNVKAVVPMGTDVGVVFQGNRIDQSVTELRELLRTATGDAQSQQHIADQIEKIRGFIENLQSDYDSLALISREGGKVKTGLNDLRRAGSDEFWQALSQDPEPQLEFLETRIAPLMPASQPILFDMLGTDLEQFEAAFDRFAIVRGTRIPPGKRGTLLNNEQYERFFKDSIARVFDAAHQQIHGSKATIAEDYELVYKIAQRRQEYKNWLQALSPQATGEIVRRLQRFLDQPDGDIHTLLPEFLSFDDSNFQQRYDFFYESIAPIIPLYQVNIGDVIAINKLGNKGQSSKVKVYGTYTFKGVEKSGFASIFHLVDLVTFRESYGFTTEAKRKEMAALIDELGVETLSAESAEDALFSSDEVILSDVDTMPATSQDDFLNLKFESRGEDYLNREYSAKEMQEGAIINVAIVLHNVEEKEQTLLELEDIAKAKGLPIQIMDWQEAAGFVGQMITVLKVVLVIFLVFVFAVSMVVVNNAILMATIHRYHEIGTLRAIGASRNTVLGLLLTESLLLTLVASFVGGALGIAAVSYFGLVGIEAPVDELQFLFGGDYLYPAINPVNLYFSPIVLLGVAVMATLYPALMATKVSPVVAMNAGD